MKKICLLCLLLALITTLLLACGGQSEAESTAPSTTEFVFPTSGTVADRAPPYLMIDGTLYWVGGQRYLLPIGEEDIVGYVTSTVPGNRTPTENDQSNCISVGTPYALYEHEEYGPVYVVQTGYYWLYLTPQD